MVPWLTLFYNCDSWKDFRGYTIVLHILNCFCWLNLLHAVEALSFPHKLPPFSSLLPLCFQNSDAYLFFMPEGLYPVLPFLLPHHCHREHPQQCLALITDRGGDREVSESSVHSSASPSGKRSCRGAIHVWAVLVNSSDLCSRGRWLQE